MKIAEAHATLAFFQKHHVVEAAQLCGSPDVLQPLSDWPMRVTAIALMGNGGDLESCETLHDLVQAVERGQKMGLGREANFADYWDACERVRQEVCAAVERAHVDAQREPWEQSSDPESNAGEGEPWE